MTLKQKLFHIKLKEKWFKMRGLGISVTSICRVEGISRKTYYYWFKRYLRYGKAGLIPSSPGPKKGKGRIPREIGDKIEEIREGNNYVFLGPEKIRIELQKQGIKISLGGIYNELLRRHLLEKHMGKGKKAKLYVKDTPGVHVQMDVKYTPKFYLPYPRQYQFTAVDDCTRIAFAWLYSRKSEVCAVDFLLKAVNFFPFPILTLQTDNGNEFRYTAPNQPPQEKHPFEKACQSLEINHIFTPQATPKRNGKVERFHGSIEREFYQGICGNTPQERLSLMLAYLKFYNLKRAHLGLGMNGLTPWEKLKTFSDYQTVSYPEIF